MDQRSLKKMRESNGLLAIASSWAQFFAGSIRVQARTEAPTSREPLFLAIGLPAILSPRLSARMADMCLSLVTGIGDGPHDVSWRVSIDLPVRLREVAV
jgi:hypothetical protein